MESPTASAFGYTEAQLWFHSGAAFTRGGETEDALRAQERALTLAPPGDYTDRTLTRLDRAPCLAHEWRRERRNGRSDRPADKASARGSARGSSTSGVQELLAGLAPPQRAIPSARDLRELLETEEHVTTLTHATPNDVPAIATMLEHLDRFYGASDAEATIDRTAGIKSALFSDPPAAYALLAWGRRPARRDGGLQLPVAGLRRHHVLVPNRAVCSRRPANFRHRSQDHGPTPRDRHQRGCSRVEWTADTDNPGAQHHFYKSSRYSPVTSKIFYRAELTKK